MTGNFVTLVFIVTSFAALVCVSTVVMVLLNAFRR